MLIRTVKTINTCDGHRQMRVSYGTRGSHGQLVCHPSRSEGSMHSCR